MSTAFSYEVAGCANLRGCFDSAKESLNVLVAVMAVDLAELRITTKAPEEVEGQSHLTPERASLFFAKICKALAANSSITALTICVNITAVRDAFTLFRSVLRTHKHVSAVSFDIGCENVGARDGWLVTFVEIVSSYQQIRSITIGYPSFSLYVIDMSLFIGRSKTIVNFSLKNLHTDHTHRINESVTDAVETLILPHVRGNAIRLRHEAPVVFVGKRIDSFYQFANDKEGTDYDPRVVKHMTIAHVRTDKTELFNKLVDFQGLRTLRLIDCNIITEKRDNKKR